MTQDSKEAAKKLFEEVFVALLSIADTHGITIKEMAELLPVAQIRAMRRQGQSQQEIMAKSGYALKTIRKLLLTSTANSNYNHIDRFVGDWKTDPEFPDTLPLGNGAFPTFADIVHRYGREFRPGALLKILIEQDLITLDGQAEHVTLKRRAVVPPHAPEKLDSARVAARNFLTTLAHNTAGQEPPRMERRVWSYMIPPEDIPAVRERITAMSMAYRELVIEILAGAEAPERIENLDKSNAVGFGMYWFE